MTTLLAVDPGLLHPACAVFKGGVLVKASRVKVPKGIGPKTPVVQRCRVIAFAIAEYSGHPDEIVIEFPQIYQAGKSKGDPNNLVPLAVIGGVLAGFYPTVPIASPKPREWIGNLPKNERGDAWDSPRGERIWSRLTPAERACIVVSHDALDAVGIGLWRLGRYERRRVYSRE